MNTNVLKTKLIIMFEYLHESSKNVTFCFSNSFSVTFAKTPSKNNLKNNNNSNKKNINKKSLNFSTDKPNLTDIDNKRIKSVQSCIDKENGYLISVVFEIKKFFPNFDNKKFVYNSYVTNQIKVIFREFYENWSDKMFARKKTKRSISTDGKLKECVFSFKPKLNKITLFHATRYRNNLFNNHNKTDNVLLIDKKEDSNFYIVSEKNKKTVTLEQIYSNLKLKKEKYIF